MLRMKMDIAAVSVRRQFALARIRLFGFDYQSDPAPFLSIVRAAPPCWRAVEVLYFNGNKGHGNQSANIYVRGENADGTPAFGMTIRQSWPDGADNWAEKALELRTSEEIPGDPQIVGRQFAGCDFFMSRDGHRPAEDQPGPYTIQAMGQFPSDVITGFGLEPNWAHSAFRVLLRFVPAEIPPPPPPPAGDYVTLAQVQALFGAERQDQVAAVEAMLAQLKGGV